MPWLHEDLRVAMSALDDRAKSEPGLERYRVHGDTAALDAVPAGWLVSDAIASIATEGGWWPGEWRFPFLDDTVPLVLTASESRPPDAAARWVGVGAVWERDIFWTPALRVPSETAPLFGFSSQALWSSMVFPTEAAMLEAFTVTFDELGLDERGEVNPFFVEWVTRPPPQHESAAARRVHRRLAELSMRWATTHRCWVDGAMPRVCWEPGLDDWPDDLAAAILGRPRMP